MSLVDVWWLEALYRVYSPWIDSPVVSESERQRAEARVQACKEQLGRLDTQLMPSVR